jgi:glyoxylase-like metal-dependent hydrolase (beta-lactamase superfamily II)
MQSNDVSAHVGIISCQQARLLRTAQYRKANLTGTLLPAQLHVFVRDWLSSNNILLKSRDGNVLIDSGYVRHAPLTLALLASRQGIGDGPLARLVNTHCHSDHMGGNAAIKSRYGCPIALPEGEAPLISSWDEKALWLGYCDQRADRFDVDEIIVPGESRVWGDLEWRALAAPGHDMRALVFYNPEHRLLVSGDALWENGYGIVMPVELEPSALPATRATLDMLANLDVRVVIPGHGDPFTDVSAALDRAFRRTTAFEADGKRVARHMLKVLLVFALLDKQRMRIADLPRYLDTVAVYRDFNALFFGLSPADLAQLLVGELERSHAVRREDGWLRSGGQG